ncbi:hypothetical protein vseg_018854 [Gypsophila vaccaria]
MAKPKRMRKLVGLLKDKLSLLKATTLLLSSSAPLRVAVLRATSHSPSLEGPLAIEGGPMLLHALLQRVHQTSSAYVALKCLLSIHHLISITSPRGPHFLISEGGGPLFGKLSTAFRDESDEDTWEMSKWIRWYAVVLDHKIAVLSRTSSKKSLNFWIIFLEKVSGAPDSLHYQKNSLIYEVMKLVGEEYRVIVREIQSTVTELGSKIEDFIDDAVDMFLGDLRRVEICKEKLLLMFLNKKKNDGFWELVDKVTRDVEELKRKREGLKMVTFTGISRRDESRAVVVAPPRRGRRWLDVEWNKLVVPSTA